MPTKIFDVDVDALPPVFKAAVAYDDALFLVRKSHIPIGKLTLSVFEGRIDGRELRAAIDRDLWWAIHEIASKPNDAAARIAPSSLSATVVVCTRERPEDLTRCLTAILALPKDGQDVLVVDNRPDSDATRDVVARFKGVRYVRQETGGLAAARNRAIREAGGEIIAYCDDDTVPDRNWLRGLLSPFEHPMVQCVTGLTMPLELELPAQEEFETYAGFSHRGFNRRAFHLPGTHPLATGQIGAGANMGIRRSIAEKIGGFDEALDSGTPTLGGGDHEYYSRVIRAGYRVVYEPAAMNWHRHRRTPGEVRKVMHAYGVGVYAHFTRSLVVDGEWAVFPRAFSWFRHNQAPELIAGLFGSRKVKPVALTWAELRGCWGGPLAYFKSRRRVAHGG